MAYYYRNAYVLTNKIMILQRVIKFITRYILITRTALKLSIIRNLNYSRYLYEIIFRPINIFFNLGSSRSLYTTIGRTEFKYPS